MRRYSLIAGACLVTLWVLSVLMPSTDQLHSELGWAVGAYHARFGRVPKDAEELFPALRESWGRDLRSEARQVGVRIEISRDGPTSATVTLVRFGFLPVKRRIPLDSKWTAKYVDLMLPPLAVAPQ